MQVLSSLVALDDVFLSTHVILRSRKIADVEFRLWLLSQWTEFFPVPPFLLAEARLPLAECQSLVL